MRENLKQARKAARLTQQAMADKLRLLHQAEKAVRGAQTALQGL